MQDLKLKEILWANNIRLTLFFFLKNFFFNCLLLPPIKSLSSLLANMSSTDAVLCLSYPFRMSKRSMPLIKEIILEYVCLICFICSLYIKYILSIFSLFLLFYLFIYYFIYLFIYLFYLLFFIYKIYS